MKALLEKLGDYSNDLKLNFSSIIENSENSELTMTQTVAIALASSYATKTTELFRAMENYSKEWLNEDFVRGAKAAASIMGMNNVYYRATHVMTDDSYRTLPTGLRMNIIGKPGIEKLDFELMALAVSVVNGCGMCIDAHARYLEKHGIEKPTIQQILRIASIMNGIAQAIVIV